ncbi:MAG: hypothetical protein ACREYF_09935 [Gammaproteobacteria bacterium]
MYDIMGYVSTLWATPGGAAVGALIACLIFGVVTFGLYKWVNRERQAPDTEEHIGGAQLR